MCSTAIQTYQLRHVCISVLIVNIFSVPLYADLRQRRVSADPMPFGGDLNHAALSGLGGGGSDISQPNLVLMHDECIPAHTNMFSISRGRKAVNI